MSDDNRYNIILPDNHPNQSVPEHTLRAFAQLFDIGEQQAQRLFDQAPILIKKEIDALTTQKFVYALKRIEVEVQVTRCQPDDTLILPPITPPPEDYRSSVTGSPNAAFVSIQVPQGQAIRTEASSMVTVSANLRMAAKIDGGFGLRLTDDTLFLNEFLSTDGTGTIGIAPALPGDIVHIQLAREQTLYLCSNNYLASSPEVQLDNASDQECTPRDLLQCRGPGHLWFCSAGAVLPMEVDNLLYVRPDRLIAWDDSLHCQHPRARNSGHASEAPSELCLLQGNGRLWLQTCSESSIAQWCKSLMHLTDS